MLHGEKTPFRSIEWFRYLFPDGEQRLPSGVHENDLVAAPRGVVVDSEHQVPLGVEHREPVPVKEQRLPPHRQRRRLRGPRSAVAGSLGRGRLRRRRGVGVNLRHLHRSPLPPPVAGSETETETETESGKKDELDLGRTSGRYL